ncbi:hypothetical protein P167DRAFT_545619 [Morchella conica CCBAS932]|uniref:C2H2-type domain-containing protein n=1 Tax=Morchella conica CCBAS932 TaxID=1392247 RepID=A0A3N4KS98_9PEZI|nr:hypothetical protein P167DRAFT_545619 [Morchella conica CCBAS932]
MADEEFTAWPWPMIDNEQFTVLSDGIEHGVDWDPEGVVPADHPPDDMPQATDVRFPQDHSHFEQAFFQDFDAGLPQTVTPAELHYGFDASAVHDGPFNITPTIRNNVEPFFRRPTELGFTGHYGGYGNNIGEFHYHSDVFSHPPEFQNLCWTPSQGTESDDPLNSSVEQSFFHARERHLGKGEWNADESFVGEDAIEDGIDEGQSQCSEEVTSPKPIARSHHLNGCGPEVKKRRNKGGPVEKRTCKLCGVVLSHSTSLKRHYAQHLSTPQHFTASQILIAEEYCAMGKPLTRCKYCALLSNRPASIAVHERTHAEGINITKCLTCGVVLTSAHIRKEHMRSHKNDLRGTFMRDGCHRSRTTFDKEDEYDFNYTGIDPVEDPAETEVRSAYECRLCAAVLVSRALRRRHYSVHKDIEEGGDRKMVDKHLAKSATEEPDGEEEGPNCGATQVILSRFRCQMCGVAFKTRYFMQKHQALHYEGEENDIAKKRKLDISDNGDSGNDEPSEVQRQKVNSGAKRVKGTLPAPEMLMRAKDKDGRLEN